MPIPDRRPDLHRDGFIQVRALFAPHEVEAILAAVAAAQVGPSGVEVWLPAQIPPALWPLLLAGPTAEWVAAACGDAAEFLSAKPVFKHAATSFATPWHQDRLYWGGTPKWSLWIALDAATPMNGCLRVIPGSHRHQRDHEARSRTNGFEHRYEVSADEAAHIVDVPCQPGDAILFHDLLLHASHANRSGMLRRCFIPTYRSSRDQDTSRVWTQGVPLARQADPSGHGCERSPIDEFVER